MAFCTEEAVARKYFLEGFYSVLDLKDCSFSAYDEDGLAAVLMSVEAD